MVFLIIIFIAVILIGMSGIRNNNSTDVKTNNLEYNYVVEKSEDDISDEEVTNVEDIIDNAVKFFDGFHRLQMRFPDFLGTFMLLFENENDNKFKINGQATICGLRSACDAELLFVAKSGISQKEHIAKLMGTTNFHKVYADKNKYELDEGIVKISVVLGMSELENKDAIRNTIASRIEQQCPDIKDKLIAKGDVINIFLT